MTVLDGLVADDDCYVDAKQCDSVDGWRTDALTCRTRHARPDLSRLESRGNDSWFRALVADVREVRAFLFVGPGLTLASHVNSFTGCGLGLKE